MGCTHTPYHIAQCTRKVDGVNQFIRTLGRSRGVDLTSRGGAPSRRLPAGDCPTRKARTVDNADRRWACTRQEIGSVGVCTALRGPASGGWKRMTAEDIKQWLTSASQGEREDVFRHLRVLVFIHPLEKTLHTTAEVILEAIARAGGLTLRMIRGVIAEAAFDVEVAAKLTGWQRTPIIGNPSHDVQLTDAQGSVRVQVKLQRSKAGQPMTARQAVKKWSERLYVAETQKTRAGKKKTSAKKQPKKVQPSQSTRPYRFGEFDILAVAMYPTTGRWDTFMYTVGNWLVPDPNNTKLIFKLQPVAGTANTDWSDDILTAISWLRSGTRKTIGTA